MRSREEFRALIAEKEKAYYAARRVRYRRWMYAALPIAACFVLCCVLALPQLSERGFEEYALPDTDMDNVSSLNMYTGAGAVNIEGSAAMPLVSFLENLALDENSEKIPFIKDETSETQEEEPKPSAQPYRIEIAYRDGSCVSYTIWEERYVQMEGGALLYISEEKARQLAALIEDLVK
ncbi:MAG: hypothetical protein KHW59_02435 [Clostridiales bacterium]|nr:hypothetical protein [Clostridiales bacterium]